MCEDRDPGVVVTPNACHARAFGFFCRTGIQVSKKQNVFCSPIAKKSDSRPRGNVLGLNIIVSLQVQCMGFLSLIGS